MTIPQSAVTRALSTWVFQHVWNEPEYESSGTVQLRPAGSRFFVNAILTTGDPIALPTPWIQYAAFWVDIELMNDTVIIPNDTWIGTDQLGEDHRTLFHVYSETGLMLPKACVFLYHGRDSRIVYVAVNKNALLAIVGIGSWNQLYISTYRYAPASPSVLTIASYQVSNPDPTNSSAGSVHTAITSAVSRCPKGTFLYVNGYDRIATSSLTLMPGDYVDIYTDTTVFGSYTVDLSNTATGYFSSLYQGYREVLHCPRAANPTNLILTNELLTFTARRNSDSVGCFIHRNEPNGITQITHSDVGIDTNIVNAYRTSLGTSDISIEVRLRSNGVTLVRDRNFIDYLYLCNDATILSLLIGTGDPTLPFWTAATLEQSAYVEYMTTPPIVVSTETLSSYVNGLGYYTVMSAICQHDRTFVVNELPVNDIAVLKPLILSGMQAYPLVYLDGIKLRDTQVDYVNTHQDKILFSLTPDVYVSLNQTLTVELIESGSSVPYEVSPLSTASSFTVPFSGVIVYEVVQLTTAVIGYGVSATTAYMPVPCGMGTSIQLVTTSNGGTTLTFQPSTYGNTYVIQNASFSRCYGLDITSQVLAVSPIHIELTTTCNNNGPTIPLLGYKTLAVYLNGRRMIDGIDYAANPVTDSSGNVAIVQIMICNRSALSLTGLNYLEVVAHTASQISRTVGYATNNKLNIQNDINMWYSGLCSAFVGGFLLVNPTDAGNEIIPSPPVGNGLPFMTVAEVPSYAATVLSGFASTADDQRITIINTYFNQQPPINDASSLIIPKSWELFSPYLTAIIYDAVQPGQVILFTEDTDPTLFKLQFTSYSYLLANDPTLSITNSAIDTRYCDIYPCYASVTAPDLGTYAALQRLAGLLLPPDSDTLGEVLDA